MKFPYVDQESQKHLKALEKRAKKSRSLVLQHYRVVELSDDPRQYHKDPGQGCDCGACEKLFPKATP